jgi:hypothetical protein
MPGSEGVYSILEQGVRADDTKFAQIYLEARSVKRKSGALAPAPASSVNIAVLDSGIVASGDTYFRERMAASGSAQSGVGVQLTNGLPATEGQHGAHVASIAASGTNMIKIIDVQVGCTQEGGNVELSVWSTAFKWAIEQRARVVNVSVVCPWGESAVKSIVEQNTGVLFLATSGNANTEFTAQYRTQNGFDKGNVILVSGCARNGDRQDQRGYGEGIDVFVPSVSVPGYVAKRFAQQVYYKRDLAYRNSEDSKLNKDRQTIATLEAKLAKDPDNAKLKSSLAREKKSLAMGERNLPQVPASADAYPLNELAQLISDSGVSFGIPMVANVAAKMMLIMPNLTPEEIRALMKSESENCRAGHVLDPVKCYQAALAKRKEWAARL